MVVKVLMNPFYKRGARIRDPVLERVVREVARQRLVPTSVSFYSSFVETFFVTIQFQDFAWL